jgi:mRNA-degrading endonuclease RelE of RelBE toxin-antitoxin system
MSYEIVLAKKAEKELRGLDKIPRLQLSKRIEQLSKDPFLGDKIEGLEYWKLRAGDYRAIYAVLENKVRILRIGHRRNIYKRI